jgi:D-serine deaminase-like pyridoxal phosphate-dependent protein
MPDWFEINDTSVVSSPALLVYPLRIEENVRRMIRIAGDPSRLRPHVKTHKMSEVVKLQIKHGITKFKCSTIAEAEMAAEAGASDILLAMQPVGIHSSRFIKLAQHYPGISFATIADTWDVISNISKTVAQYGTTATIWLDINNGMNRTGIPPGKEALELYIKAAELPFIRIAGLHVYDGHIHHKNLIERQEQCENDFRPVYKLIQQIRELHFPEPQIVAGGTPTFPLHAERKNTEASPGTCLLWDYGYSEGYPDLDFMHAAVLMTRVVSKPAKNLLCLDLGHKSIAAEMPHPRIKLIDIEVTGFINHSEEHLVIETPEAEKFKPGDVLYGIPRHICPTVPRYPFAFTVENGKVTGQWKIDARDRMITI